MLRFIKLTELYYSEIDSRNMDDDVFVNVDSIVYFHLISEGRTRVFTTNGRAIDVKETPEEIVEKLGLTPAVK